MESEHSGCTKRFHKYRRRTIRSCDTCRKRKVKCDQDTPCQNCVVSRYDCTYSNLLQPRTAAAKPRSIQPRSLALSDIASAEIAPSINTQGDLLQTQLTISQTLESNEKHRELRAGIAAFNSDTQAYQFYGPSSHFSFVQRLYQRIHRQSNKPLMMNTQRTIPEGLQRWGVHRQMFPKVDEQARANGNLFEGSVMPQDMGKQFITKYFTIVHPQAPILDRADIFRTWGGLSEILQHKHTAMQEIAIERSILYMVFAIGASLSDGGEQNHCKQWAELYFERATNLSEPLQETSLGSCHVLILRAIYAMQISRPNWIYL